MHPRRPAALHNGAMVAARVLMRAVRGAGAGDSVRADPAAPPLFWGRIGAYEAVSRGGVLFLLAPQPLHPSVRVKVDA